MSCGGNLADENWEAGQDWAVQSTRGGLQLQETVQVATQQVELSGLEVVGRLHGAPNALWDLQEQLDLRRHGVELVLPLSLTLHKQGDEIQCIFQAD